MQTLENTMEEHIPHGLKKHLYLGTKASRPSYMKFP